MPHIALRCTSCGATHPADMATLSCKDCSSPLDVEYLVGPQGESTLPSRGQGAFAVPLPLHNSASAITLGEGNTPCVQLSAIGGLLGLGELYAKLEFLNPTGSFKDLGTAVMVSVAREHGVTELVEDSSRQCGSLGGRLCRRGRHQGPHFCAIHSTTGQAEADQGVRRASPSDRRTTGSEHGRGRGLLR